MRATKKTIGRRSGIVAVIVLMLIGGGIGFAAWTSNGTGTASTTAATAKTLTIASGTPVVQGLFPTGAIQVPVAVTNTNPYKVEVQTLTVNGITTAKAGCTVAGVVTATDLTGLSVILDAAGGANATKEISVPVSMTNAAANACQGAAFTLDVSVTGTSTP